jgi:hypothetical protein
MDPPWMQGKRSLGFAHHFRPTYPDFLHEAPPTPVCAAFIKESRMKCANAIKLDRKFGVRLGERGAPVDCLRRCYDTDSFGTHQMLRSPFVDPAI